MINKYGYIRLTELMAKESTVGIPEWMRIFPNGFINSIINDK